MKKYASCKKSPTLKKSVAKKKCVSLCVRAKTKSVAVSSARKKPVKMAARKAA